MCGIVGGVSERNVVPIILEGLNRLEYRGYDSVGIAVVNQDMHLARQRVTGRVKQLKELCKEKHFNGLIGIGHTRWATHGGVSVENAHPHFSNATISVVHNGIIENYSQLKESLISQGYIFDSQTDTEVIAHLIHSFYIKQDLFKAVKLAISKLEGAYAIGIISKDIPDKIICARFGCPLIIGIGINEMFFASDISALLPVTQEFIYMEDGEIAELDINNWHIYDKNNKLLDREINISHLSLAQTELGKYRHFMQKEIFEQPTAISETLQRLGTKIDSSIFGKDAQVIFKKIKQVQIVACGTSYNAGLVAKYWIEELARLNCSVDIASEYRYRKTPAQEDTLIIAISQSGETADTVAAIKYAQELGMKEVLSICNVPESTLVRLSKLSILTQGGPEIGVASTKAFTTQLVVLLYLAVTLAKDRQVIAYAEIEDLIKNMLKLPQLVSQVLNIEPEIVHLAKDFEHKQHALFLGRHALYPIAMEGALKLKEISYIHAESYAAGELKHGPLALIDKKMPVIVLMPTNLLFDKMKSNVEEILARKGSIYLISDTQDAIINKVHKTLIMPEIQLKYLLPIIYAIPLQLLAYHTALLKGTDVDKPRNLAKSVTVE